MQKRFFGHFLKGEDTSWDTQPRVLLQVRHPDRFEERAEGEWPIARTQWTKYYLDPTTMAFGPGEPGASRGDLPARADRRRHHSGLPVRFDLPCWNARRRFDRHVCGASRVAAAGSALTAIVCLAIRRTDPARVS